MNDLSPFPGGDLVEKGLSDLAQHFYSEEALLVLVARPRLVNLGFMIPNPQGVEPPFEHALYGMIQERLPRGAHSANNALLQRIASFTNTYAAHIRER